MPHASEGFGSGVLELAGPASAIMRGHGIGYWLLDCQLTPSLVEQIVLSCLLHLRSQAGVLRTAEQGNASCKALLFQLLLSSFSSLPVPTLPWLILMTALKIVPHFSLPALASLWWSLR